MKTEDQVQKAIEWLDSFPNAVQEKDRKLGGVRGGCPLGIGAQLFEVPDYDPDASGSHDFANLVGLNMSYGEFTENHEFKGQKSIVSINDDTDATLQEIADYLKANPFSAFKTEVAEFIYEHYKNEILP